MASETVLVVGASGNIGVSAIIAALRSGRNVVALVRNQASAEKMFQHVGSRQGIIAAEADVLSEDGVHRVVERVRAGKLPPFQHVYSSVGAWNPTTPLQNIDTASFRHTMNICLEANFFAYRATVPYLLEQGHPRSTWTLCTGSAGDFGSGGVTAISQGALFSMANAACRELSKTNIRFNEVYLSYRVDFDAVADEKGNRHCMKSSYFAKVYEGILAKQEINGCRVTVRGANEVENLTYEKKTAVAI